MKDKVSLLNRDHEMVRDHGAFIVAVDKLGGGTLGREYTGTWEGFVYDSNANLIEKVPITTGMPHTHWYVGTLISDEMWEG